MYAIFCLYVQSDCTAVNSTVLTCITPQLPAGTSMVSYLLRLDGAPPPNTSFAALMLGALPDPVLDRFTPTSVPLSTLSSVSILLTIEVSIKDIML